MKKTFIILLILAVLLGVLYFMAFPSYQASPEGKEGSKAPDHTLWGELLEKHVKADGLVDYTGFQADASVLQSYLDLISENAPTKSWSEEEKIAYWINAYNAYTVKIIADNYPLESIRELHRVPGVATIWHEEFFEIGGLPMSLNQIEHGILRVEFEEPRIHFAINCASMSCPVLRAEAYVPEKLDAQLHEQAQVFLQQTLRNQLGKEVVKLSKIFSWFSGDFTKNGSLIDYLNQFLDKEEQIAPDTEIEYLTYDWAINAYRVSS